MRGSVRAGGGEGAANGEPAGGRQGSWFVRNTAPDAIAVSDRSFAVDGILDDRACKAYLSCSVGDVFCKNYFMNSSMAVRAGD